MPLAFISIVSAGGTVLGQPTAELSDSFENGVIDPPQTVGNGSGCPDEE